MVRPNDEFWDYIEKVGGRFKCKFCGFVFSGKTSIWRFKCHLSGVEGQGVNVCGQVPADVKQKAYDATQNCNKRCKTVPSSSYNEATNSLPSSSGQQTNEIENGARVGEMAQTEVQTTEQETGVVRSPFDAEFINAFETLCREGLDVIHNTLDAPNIQAENEVRDARMVGTEVQSSEREMVQREHEESREMPQEYFIQLNETGVPRGSRNEARDCVAELMKKSKFEGAFVIDAPPPAVELLQLPRVMEKASVERTLQKILECIANERFHTIGIWGMGGAGKTTAMKALNNLPEISKAFDIVIWVTVSSQGSVEMIQKKVAERLSLSLRNEESIESRASKISQSLNSKRFVLLLDDVWKMIDLENIGIPYQGNGSKVVLTTRSLTVCNSMETDANVKVNVLSEKEAWDLFSSKVGEVVFSKGITGYARDVVKECDGLPLAIIVLGAALRNTDDVHVWRNALRELRSPTSFTIEGMEDRVFKSLKFSYDHLRDDNMKQCFLYCALYPEDHVIKDAELIEYWRVEDYW